MSDATSSQNALDPDRPWITDEEQLPSRMNWLDTFFNPTGKSSKLHFTRAWTVLFFAQFLSWFGLGLLLFVVGVIGGGSDVMSAGRMYFVAIVFGVTTLLSFVIHSRRLNHAGKTSLWALIVLLPLILGGFLFVNSVGEKSAEYDKLYEARAEFLEDPAVWRETRLEERRVAQAKAEQERLEAEAAKAAAEAEGGEQAEGQGGSQRGGNGGGRGNWNSGPSAENELPSPESFIVRPNVPIFYLPIMLLSALVMIWSLLWVARTEDRRKSGRNDEGTFEQDRWPSKSYD